MRALLNSWWQQRRLIWFFFFGLILPNQLGKHFWPDFSFIHGVRSDYLAPTLFLTDLWLLIGWMLIRPPWPTRRQTFPLLLFLALTVFSINVGPLGLIGYRLYQLLRLLICYWVFRQANFHEQRAFLQGLIGAAIWTLVLALGQIARQGSLQGWWYWLGERSFTINTPGIATVCYQGSRLLRSYATFSHPNTLAGFYLISTLLFIKANWRLPTIITMILVTLAFSKFALIITAGILLLTLGQSLSCRICLIGKIFFSLWLILLAIIFQGDPNSLNERWQGIILASSYILSHPWGKGPGQFLQLAVNRQPVHNGWLLLLIEFGWLMFPFLIWVGAQLVRRIRQQPAWLPLILAVFLTFSFDHYWLTQVQTQCLLGISLGIIWQSEPSVRTRH